MHLEPLAQKHLKEYYGLFSDECMSEMIKPDSYEIFAHWFHSNETKEEKYRFDYVMSENGIIVGAAAICVNLSVAYKAELSYFVKSNNQKKGYATKALCELESIAKAKEQPLKITRLECYVMPSNMPSIRVCEKNGYENEGLLKQGALNKYGKQDAYLFAKIIGD